MHAVDSGRQKIERQLTVMTVTGNIKNIQYTRYINVVDKYRGETTWKLETYFLSRCFSEPPVSEKESQHLVRSMSPSTGIQRKNNR